MMANLPKISELMEGVQSNIERAAPPFWIPASLKEVGRVSMMHNDDDE